MAVGTPSLATQKYGGLDRERMIWVYRTMYLSRKMDEKEIHLHRQGRTFFEVSAAGHEALQMAAALSLRAGYDWVIPYYRGRTLALALGVTPAEQLLEAMGSAVAPFSGGRQMPSHWGSKPLHIVSRSSATGMQWAQAVGCAEAGVFYKGSPDAAREAAKRGATFEKDEIVCVTGGDGATSEGEFYESLNAAGLRRAPVLFLIEDNGFAISVPVEAQTTGANISRLLAGYPSLHLEEVDGTDFWKSLEALRRAAAYCRERRGPALVHGHVLRLHSHSLSDDQRLYRTPEEIAAEARRDPVAQFAAYLEAEGVLSAEDRARVQQEVQQEIENAAAEALRAPAPQPGTVRLHVYSPKVDPCSAEFDRSPRFTGEPRTMVELLNACLRDELKHDPRVVMFGEDIADCSREANLPRVKGKGGVFKVTHGLQRQFGIQRVFNAPIAEANIVGRAIGMALRGLKPVVEIQFFDYIWPAMMQIRDELAVLRWRSLSNFSCPVVIRVPIGGYLSGGSIYHSQSGECIFTHTPGLRVVMPSNALDANGLLRTAIRCDDPVLFLEHKHLYRQTYNRSPYPGPDYMIPFGKASIVREGKDLTVVTYGAVVQKALQAAEKLAEEGVSAELIDLRSLNPFDWDAIATSVRKTSRVLVAHEDCLSFGYGAEIAARLAEELFHELDAPVKRVGAEDTFVAYHPNLEKEILPQAADLEQAMRELAAS
ncbi:MAG: dehydrogenase E1 component subunit alpha/beta [Acidobacteria bacterium]|nr:dehydrogenase E1 component subunit alpha/beta [Acidobacteriota bacterium]